MVKAKKIIKKVSNITNINLLKNDEHVWQFSRIGGVNRVNLETGSDLVCLDQLDQTLWTALSCPVYELEIDSKTLELIDYDKDGRIRVPEILAAVKWITSLILHPEDLIKGSSSFPLSAINTRTDEGKILLDSAKQILANLNTPNKHEISVEESSDTVKIFADTKFNGDGVITPISSDDIFIQNLIENIIQCVGYVVDLNGKEGITKEHIEYFYSQSQAYSEWYAKADNNILPFGTSTFEAFDAIMTIKPKIEDYFLRCRMADFDKDSICKLNDLNTVYEELSKKNLSECLEEISNFPLTKIESTKPLSIFQGINPAWKNRMDAFIRLVIKPHEREKEKLTESEWQTYLQLFDKFKIWQEEKKGNEVEPLGLDYIHEILNNSSKETLLALIEQDLTLETNTKNIMLVDKFSRYYRDLYILLNNYVTFHDFYAPDKKAIFQCGKLYIDQRCCDLCIKVNDIQKHYALAKNSAICLLYCECTARTKKGNMIIVAALTDGDLDNIEIGRNALFYDRQGDDWDATIIKILDNPISIRQAFWSPYRKFSRFISQQVEKFASNKEKAVDATASTKIEEVHSKADDGLKKAVSSAPISSGSLPPAAPFDIGKFVGIFAALSLALGAIGSVLASFLTGFFGLSWWKMPLAIIGIFLCISGPSMILAWLKLRKRNLAPLLDANGWAINARASINIVFGKTLTQIAKLPENSKLNLVDPLANKKRPLIPILLLIILILGVATYLLWYFKIIIFKI